MILVSARNRHIPTTLRNRVLRARESIIVILSHKSSCIRTDNSLTPSSLDRLPIIVPHFFPLFHHCNTPRTARRYGLIKTTLQVNVGHDRYSLRIPTMRHRRSSSYSRFKSFARRGSRHGHLSGMCTSVTVSSK